ncbi:RecQ family ATP-dependent DNA helicase [Marinomonas posidonica]|uniref:ATP-dependent DNA helicase RecQ n=1 Tax=Marinomonas posidonica (strain CECT 7376 / NCIMB 14433 / IVIA-Po-181) TaxID=491952 RepID=F6D0G7_MARPP|nr:ATP-dependent DNA helicase RecQ [Marinomonas posidonica]AEF54765.1 ATP-dependent DNA helicase, RecQ family [Marinomonas posidonica IVIA-Po-181]
MTLKKRQALKRLGYSDYRPLQEEAIDALSAGQDVVLAAPTGGGKSLIYQSVGLIRHGVAVIISPLISLMTQQVDQLNAKDIHAKFLNSTLNPGEQDDLVWSIRHDRIEFLYLSPEKLIQPSVMGFLQSVDIALFAIDEAHCIAQWGGDFRPEYSQLGKVKQSFPTIPIIALTGSADKQTLAGIQTSLGIPNADLIKGSIDRPNIQIQIAQKKQAKQQILYFLHHEVSGQSGIIYCRSRNKTEELCAWLSHLGFNSLTYHAAMKDEDKQRNHATFSRETGTIMVATTAYGMGIDLPQIRFVIHMDIPNTPEAYYQEIGRAGRDNEPAKALLLYGLQDMLKAQQLVSDTPEQARVELAKLTRLFQILENRQCRKLSLLAHFDEISTPCGICDRCISKQAEHNATIASQKLLSLIYYTKGTQAFSTLIQILLGKRTKTTSSIQAEKLPLFGKGKELTEAQWKTVIRHLLAFEYIQLVGNHSFLIQLNEKARQVLKGQSQVILANDHYYPRMTEEELMKDHANWHKVKTWLYNQQEINMTDGQLRKICQHKPTTAASLSRLSGISIDEVSRFSDSLLSLLHEKSIN